MNLELHAETVTLAYIQTTTFFNEFVEICDLNDSELVLLKNLLETRREYEKAADSAIAAGFTLHECLKAYKPEPAPQPATRAERRRCSREL